jgi:hypothetical protein
VRAPIHFRPLYAARFRASLRARAGPNTAAVKDEGVGLSGKLSKAQHAAILLPGPRHAAVAASSSTSILHVPGFSHAIMLCTQAVGVGPVQAAEWPADLAPVRFNCWQSTSMDNVIILYEVHYGREADMDSDITQYGTVE